MAWELLLESCSSEPVAVDEVNLVSGPLKKTWSAAEVAAVAMHLKSDSKRASGIARVSLKTDRLQIPAGETAAIYLWHEALTMTLVHGVRFSGAHATDEIQVSVEPAAIASSVAPPLLGPGWFSSSAPANQSPHRRAFYRFDNGMHIAQRYAIDFVRTDEEGVRIHGDPTHNESYMAYGAPVIAIADGLMMSVKDGIPDNQPAGCPPPGPNVVCEIKTAVQITRDTVAGNYVLVDHGEGRYATYAHLVPGSLTVREGDPVARGQVLAKVGNSGNSQEPHLHFHVCNGASVLDCEGIPVQFEQFVAFPVDPRRGPTGPPAFLRDAIPASSNVLTFPDENGQIAQP
jgi:murein DD-endopeptidase MepM/ murein hydrolase activator NlpD